MPPILQECLIKDREVKALVNQTSIDNKLHECEKICTEARLSGHPKHYLYSWALMAINRHINTGRASVMWLEKFLAADTRTLMDKASKYSGSDDACIKAVNRYLRIS